MPFLWTHSRVSFGQTVRAAKRAGQLRYYQRTMRERIAVLAGGAVHQLACPSYRAQCEHRQAATGRARWARQAEGR